MGPARLEAFSDAALAVIITIMVLELRPPDGDDLPSLESLLPKLLIYQRIGPSAPAFRHGGECLLTE
jgi:uncharacterized membrane protein